MTEFFEVGKRGLISGLKLAWKLTKIIVPVYIIVMTMDKIGLIAVLAKYFQPFMDLLGLPGEAAIVLMLGYFLTLYAALGALAAISLTVEQINIIALMLLISHGLLIEAGIMREAKVPALKLTLIRVGVSLAVGMGLNLVL